MGHDVELNSLGQRTALSNGDNITLLHAKAGTAVSMNVLVTFLETTVLLDVVKVVPPHNDGALHLGRDDKSLQDLTTDGNVASEWALLVNVGSLDGGVGGLDAQSDVLHPAHRLHLLGVGVALAGDEDGILGLVCLFVLYREPPPHDNGAHDVNLHHSMQKASLQNKERVRILKSQTGQHDNKGDELLRGNSDVTAQSDILPKSVSATRIEIHTMHHNRIKDTHDRTPCTP
mmetsp:Transcript_25449/g.43446  ORF Transcript_25449/g.43446 Transcript_25449/m.43446 type:complete len:231 (-) Transcript_25449:72-764(-)|eukprot:CAMPEP_0184406246 /NCGR_PEP_ID=MMETSP0738-20130409/1422_1 /TAXON_ID=385413 /ORGANISM="Thalassiosira miniscula, Strain CCMP1093" /LENGTH=230 /DNA_ID=CAMNT_0026763061 /DNA_START=116 /DNA_END=808 /DNA_ORIENTATION=-